MVLDVTVRYEMNVDTLKKAYHDKRKHYKSIKNMVMKSMGVMGGGDPRIFTGSERALVQTQWKNSEEIGTQ